MFMWKLSAAVPPLTGNDANLFYLSICSDIACLPPLIVWSVQHMQDVPEVEVQSLTRETRILRPVIVEQGSGARNDKTKKHRVSKQDSAIQKQSIFFFFLKAEHYRSTLSDSHATLTNNFSYISNCICNKLQTIQELVLVH